MSLWPAHIYLLEARKSGLPDDQARAALTAAHGVQAKGLPAILSLKHLALHTGVSYTFLRGIVERRASHVYYRFFNIKKRSGGRRLIAVPHPELQRVQKWIARNLLNTQSCHSAAYAYVRGKDRGHQTCAKVHCGAKWILKWDLADFFHSISERSVYRVFRRFGYGALVSLEMARVCTSDDCRGITRPSRFYASILDYNVEREGFVPQGAPCSPMLSNHVAAELDGELAQVAKDLGFVYTRYADDITFSSAAEDLSREQIREINLKVERAITTCGFRTNRSKFRVCRPGSRKVVLGLLVDGEAPRLTRRYKARLRQHIHFLLKRGPRQHAKRIGFHSVMALHEHLVGLIGYASTIDPEFATRISEQFATVAWPVSVS
jgi:RNA-directed DNA polymerase